MSLSFSRTAFFFIACAAAQATRSAFTISLMKQDVPVVVKGRVVAHKSAYFGNVQVGMPATQNFTVVFDTGSGHFFLPSSACNDGPCQKHRRYDRSLSQSGVDVNHDGSVVSPGHDSQDQVSIAYGTGEILGEFVKEVVCVGDSFAPPGKSNDLPGNCARIRVITAREMTDEPFTKFTFDGVIGLGLEALALDPEFHFLKQLTKEGDMPPKFGVYLAPWTGSKESPKLGDAPAGEVTFGGHDERRVTAGSIKWVPVVNSSTGHWSVSIKGIRVDNDRLEFCSDGSCTGILDTGTSLLGVPKKVQEKLLLIRELPEPASGETAPDCRHVPGPSLIFELEGGLEVRLEAQDYSNPVPSTLNIKGNTHSICRSSLMPIDMSALGPKVFILGEPVLRRYYTVYDARLPAPHVGFAAAATGSFIEAPATETGESIAV